MSSIVLLLHTSGVDHNSATQQLAATCSALFTKVTKGIQMVRPTVIRGSHVQVVEFQYKA